MNTEGAGALQKKTSPFQFSGGAWKTPAILSVSGRLPDNLQESGRSRTRLSRGRVEHRQVIGRCQLTANHLARCANELQVVVTRQALERRKCRLADRHVVGALVDRGP